MGHKDTLKPGTKVKSPSRVYTIVHVLGTGAYGITYLTTTQVAIRGELGEINVNVCVTLKEFFMDGMKRVGDAVERDLNNDVISTYARCFYLEADKLSTLSHPNIVNVLEAFVANNTCYYSMEYLSGGSLSDMIQNGDGIPESEALVHIRKIGNALSYMHSRKMLHLDVKPGNIMFDYNHNVKLIDFGLSQRYGAGGESESTDGLGAGSPGYASLEQASKEYGVSFSPSLDVYGLGATYYKMLTACTPPNAIEVASAGIDTITLVQKDVSQQSIDAIKAAMQPEAEKRLQTVADFLAMLPIAECVENIEKDKPKKKKRRTAVLAVVSVLVVILGLLGALFLTDGFAESDYASLPRGDVSPEWSAAAESFYNDAVSVTAPDRAQPYSIMVVDHGKVVFEQWYDGYQPDSRFPVYSVSKTVLALAAGIAVEEGLFNVDDRVIDYFPERLPKNVSDTLSAMTIRHLLTMTSGMTESAGLLSVFLGKGSDLDWIVEFFASPQTSMPGTEFYYNFFAPYIVAAIIEKTAGTGVMNYIRPRLLEPMHITDMEWGNSPEGICVGGWDMNLCTEDMAKLGQLLLHKGEWNGRQLVSADWVDTMTSKLVESRPLSAFTATKGPAFLNDPANDHTQGYGYFVWRGKYGTYRLEGLQGNLVLVSPESETVLVFTSNSNMDQRYIDLIWKHFARLVLSD